MRAQRLLLGLFALLILAQACGSNDSAPVAPSDGDTDLESPENDGESEAEAADTAIEARPTPMRADTTFDLGPYLMHTTRETAIVKWRTKGETDGKVVYGQGDALDREAKEDGLHSLHEVTLTGLSADTRYAYKVVSGGVESEVHHLYSAPLPEQGIRFVVGSDSQGAPEILGPIVAQMAKFEPFLFLHIGDTVQSPDMSNGYDPFKTECYDAIRPLAHEIPFYVAIGNHEKESLVFYDLVSYPGLQTPARPTFESFYSFRYGNTFFLVINTNTLLLSVGSLADFVRREAASEAARSATWRIAVAHYPGYSDRSDNGACILDGYPLSRNWLLPLLDENGFHAYLSGHAHIYERGQVGRVLTLITGGLGGGLDAALEPTSSGWESIRVRRSVHHHLQVTADRRTLSFRAIDTSGAEIDHVTLDAAHYGEPVSAGPADVTDGDSDCTLVNAD